MEHLFTQRIASDISFPTCLHLTSGYNEVSRSFVSPTFISTFSTVHKGLRAVTFFFSSFLFFSRKLSLGSLMKAFTEMELSQKIFL